MLIDDLTRWIRTRLGIGKPRPGYGYVYILFNGWTRRPFYVGQTRQRPSARLSAHRSRRQSRTIFMAIVREVPEDQLDAEELRWIKRFTEAGYRLSNKRR
jgi:hypothetical protein